MKSLLEKLQRYAASGALPMHMPGHKRNTQAFPWLGELGAGLDITEIDGFDNLNEPRTLFADLERRAARLWGAEESICLVNGSTAGVLAAIRAALGRGGELLLFRGSHRSAYHAAELVGAKLHYLTPALAPDCGIWGSVTAEEVDRALAAHPGVRLVGITSPTYEGVLSDVKAIAAVCHARGVPLLVDEAHGAHLGFGGFPAGAVACGADLVVQSLHKTLPSLTQTAVLHVSGGLVEPHEVRRNVAIFQSSSPSYLLAASIDGCIGFLEREGNAQAARWLADLAAFRASLGDLKHLKLLTGGEAVFDFDPSKLVLSTAGTALTGAALMERLRAEFHIELEMACDQYALAMTGMGDTADSLARLAEAVRALDSRCERAPSKAPGNIPLPEKRLEIFEAAAHPGAFCPVEAAEGKISGEYVWAYPPGSPLLAPGEVIGAETAAALATDPSLHSTRGELPQRIFVLTEPEK